MEGKLRTLGYIGPAPILKNQLLDKKDFCKLSRELEYVGKELIGCVRFLCRISTRWCFDF